MRELELWEDRGVDMEQPVVCVRRTDVDGCKCVRQVKRDLGVWECAIKVLGQGTRVEYIHLKIKESN